MSNRDTKQAIDPLQRLRDLALAELGPMALPSERTDIMMWAAAEIERLRISEDAAWRRGAIAVLQNADELADRVGGDIALGDLLDAFPDLWMEAKATQ